jgi:hypothetical protein
MIIKVTKEQSEKLEPIIEWGKKFEKSMDALDYLGNIIFSLYKFKKVVGNNYKEDLENIAAISQMIIEFTDKFMIKDLIIKADLINLFEKYIEYADSICDFKELKEYSKDSIFPIIISALKKSHSFKQLLVSTK